MVNTEFERLFKFYTVSVIAVMFLTVVACTSLVVIGKFSRNLGLTQGVNNHIRYEIKTGNLEICTQK